MKSTKVCNLFDHVAKKVEVFLTADFTCGYVEMRLHNKVNGEKAMIVDSYNFKGTYYSQSQVSTFIAKKYTFEGNPKIAFCLQLISFQPAFFNIRIGFSYSSCLFHASSTGGSSSNGNFLVLPCTILPSFVYTS